MYTINEAMFLYQQYGTISVVDADNKLVAIFDDEEDADNRWIIDVVDI